jgi:hypothetical protein
MSYKLQDLLFKDQFNYSKEIEAILKYLKKTWDIKATPKGYKEFRKNYNDFQGMEELDEKALQKRFKGHGDGSVCTPGFVVRISLPHVVYDNNCQGRPPLETLLGAVLAHGMILGERIAEIDEMSQANLRLSCASHCLTMASYENDPAVMAAWYQELNDHFNERKLGTHPHETAKKYELIRREIAEKKLGERFRAYLKEKGGKVILRTKAKGIEQEYWRALFNLSSIIYGGNKLEEHMAKTGIIVKTRYNKKSCATFTVSLK